MFPPTALKTFCARMSHDCLGGHGQHFVFPWNTFALKSCIDSVYELCVLASSPGLLLLLSVSLILQSHSSLLSLGLLDGVRKIAHW